MTGDTEMTKEKKTCYICFRVTPSEKERFRKFAARMNTSLGGLVRLAVEKMIYTELLGKGGVTK